ncbi:MAG: hypothetical protein RLZZ592_377 [Pseudomonadota bacterium]|jgi:CDP-glycerol glycerophosphotransferase|nr:hypothetical protein [Pseudomonadota bacterium]
MNASPDLQTGLASPSARGSDLLTRVETLETLGSQVSEAIEQLVDAVVGMQQRLQPDASAPPPTLPDLQALQQRLQSLEHQVNLWQTNQDLERVSHFHRKTRSIVFVGTTYFGCNAKYGWLALREKARREGITLWFLPQTAQQEEIVRSLDELCFPCAPAEWTTEHVTAALSAAVVVTCDHFLNPNPYAQALMAGARHVQLWHGISIKEIGLRNLVAPKQFSPRFARIIATCGPYTRMIGTAAGQEDEWRRWFGFERYAPIGYPRNDVLLREPDEADLLGSDREILELARTRRRNGRRVVLYAPTFRDARRGSWILEAGIDQLARTLHQRGDLLIVNVHPVEAPLIPQLAPALPTVKFVTPRTDIYPLLREASVLVTDYSSVMFDYLLLDRPIVLFRPDDQDYRTRSRQLFDAKLDVLPGPLTTDIAALLKGLQPAEFDRPAHAEARQKLRDRLFDHPDGRAGERLAHLLDEELALALHAVA